MWDLGLISLDLGLISATFGVIGWDWVTLCGVWRGFGADLGQIWGRFGVIWGGFGVLWGRWAFRVEWGPFWLTEMGFFYRAEAPKALKAPPAAAVGRDPP